MECAMPVDGAEQELGGLEQTQEPILGTPCRVQKRLSFVSSNSFSYSSNSKRSLFREDRDACGDEAQGADTDADSDLGPMSPLALTDQSSCDSSPGRQFISPLATPEKSPTTIPLTHWSRVMLQSSQGQSPLCKASLSSRDFGDDDDDDDDEVVPETPIKESDDWSAPMNKEETMEYSESRLITPLSSLRRNLAAPRLHRRKSLTGAAAAAAAAAAVAPENVEDNNKECNASMSPEIKKCSFKRRLEDSLVFSNAKQPRTSPEETAAATPSTAPKARAALFKDGGEVGPSAKVAGGFTLAPKSFYGSSVEKTRKSDILAWREPQREVKKRRSLPSSSYSSHRRSTKKHRPGEINCGVWHGIKRPKPKRPPISATKTEEKSNNSGQNKSKDVKENLNPQGKTPVDKQQTKQVVEEIDPNKKFFKTKVVQANAVVTVNKNIKLKLDQLNQKDTKHVNKKAKLDMTFDTTDLSVDEPAIEKSLEQSNMSNILKVLEEDWADDDDDEDIENECDAMETAPVAPSVPASNILSPRKSNIMLKNLTMSPGSELSSMTYSMNIKDASLLPECQTKNHDNQNENATLETSSKKLFPLFSKNYSPQVPEVDSNTRKRKRYTASWQLSTKNGSAENQYQIDAGQKMFGATQCSECGIVYHIGDPDDENAHLNYHNSFKILKFQGWKNERVVYSDAYTSSRIILIEPKDTNLHWKKVNEILEIVDRDLGLSDMKLSCYRDKRVYMYVRDKTILGILVAEYVKSAFRMIPELSDLNCCTSETSPVKCGVNVVWTAMSHRRQGIATKLVDILRTSYYYGYIMCVDDLAFSTPTPSGKQFAEKYTKTPNFKVY